MSRALRLAGRGTYLFFTIVLAGFAARAAETSATAKSAANEDVQRVLQSEVAGEIESRAEALEPILASSPEHAAARWQAGYVRWKGKWIPFERVAELPEYQALLKSYEAARAKAGPTAAEQLELARWCRDRGLDAQERVHLENVLAIEPANFAARGRLGYVQVGNAWYTKRELAEAERHSRETDKALAKWTPRLKQILASMLKEESRERAAAEARLAEIDDLAALPAIEAAFVSAPEKAALKAVEIIAKMKSPEASISLAKFAVMNPFNDVGLAAAEALCGRPEDTYVPALLALLSTAVETRHEMWQSGNHLFYLQIFFRETEKNREWFGLSHAMLARGDSAFLLGQAVAIEGAGVRAATGARNLTVEERNAEIEKLNKRVCNLLTKVTGADLPANPHAWWQWWSARNELFMANEKPLQVGAQSTSNVVNLPTVTAAPVKLQVGPKPEPIVRKEPYGHPVKAVPLPGGGVKFVSCLVAGTPIWTASGPVAIDKLKPGDMVLSQDPQSGELAYQAVQGTTVRPAGPVLRLDLGGTKIRTTGGHPYWVVGKGWVLARHLEPGMKLRDACGTTEIKAVSDEPEAKEMTYNLIVADFHTYFVGDAMILSHDNTFRRPTSAGVPGLVAAR